MMRARTSFANRTAYVRPAREQSEKSTGTRMARISRCCARARESLEVFISSFHRWSYVTSKLRQIYLRRAFDGNRRLALTAQKLRNSPPSHCGCQPCCPIEGAPRESIRASAWRSEHSQGGAQQNAQHLYGAQRAIQSRSDSRVLRLGL